jgi:hypothetical protein
MEDERRDTGGAGEARQPLTRAKRLFLELPRCENCGSHIGVRREQCRTAYAEAHLNLSPFLCRKCADDYHDYWDNLWADYYSDSGFISRSKALAELKAIQR